MITLFCDASFDWTHTKITVEKFVRGKIAVSDGVDFNKVEKTVVGKIEGLKQYINILELIAIARAVELACDMKDEERSLRIFTDSKVAMIWASSGTINPKVATEAHLNALEYLRKARIAYGGIITFNHTPRESNPAGHLLAAELEVEKPHAI